MFNNIKVFNKLKESKAVKIILIIFIIIVFYYVFIYINKLFTIREDYKNRLSQNQKYSNLYKYKEDQLSMIANPEQKDLYMNKVLGVNNSNENVIIIYDPATSTFQEIKEQNSILDSMINRINYFIDNYTTL